MKQYLKRAAQQHTTPQDQPMPGTTQIRNSAGGYTWAISDWEHFRRFLILGSEGGSYYAKQQTLTAENANTTITCIKTDGQRAIKEIVTISEDGRAPKNDPAIFALALAATYGDDKTRKMALDALPQVCRTGTHLFSFAEMVNTLRGWGRGLRRGVGQWYTAMDSQKLAYQVVKYRQRDGWTHADTLRLAHPKPQNQTQDVIFNWITRPQDSASWTKGLSSPEDEALAYIWAFERVQMAESIDTVLQLITAYDLPREALPTRWLNAVEVWEALLPKMPMTAMIRNLGNMTKNGLIKPHSAAESLIVERLIDAERLHKARIHPISVLSALRVYQLGRGLKGQSLTYQAIARTKQEWQPSARIVDALETAFQLAFKSIQPTNKRTMLALDVSGSMASAMMAGVVGLTPRDGAAAMAMVTARTEPNYSIVSFQNEIVPLNISAKMGLADVVKATHNLPFGATDCAQPMLYALENKIPVDTFVIYTDNETWFGKVHPAEALRTYRQKMGIDARLIVVGMVANKFSIADPDDAGMLDVIGFDSAAPQVMADFARGEI